MRRHRLNEYTFCCACLRFDPGGEECPGHGVAVFQEEVARLEVEKTRIGIELVKARVRLWCEETKRAEEESQKLAGC